MRRGRSWSVETRPRKKSRTPESPMGVRQEAAAVRKRKARLSGQEGHLLTVSAAICQIFGGQVELFGPGNPILLEAEQRLPEAGGAAGGFLAIWQTETRAAEEQLDVCGRHGERQEAWRGSGQTRPKRTLTFRAVKTCRQPWAGTSRGTCTREEAEPKRDENPRAKDGQEARRRGIGQKESWSRPFYAAMSNSIFLLRLFLTSRRLCHALWLSPTAGVAYRRQALVVGRG